jgi:hypothetical protein
MPCRNEDWVLGLTARAALMWCDALVVGDHASSDSTGAIIDEVTNEFPGRVVKFEFHDQMWDEMIHRQFLLFAARSHCPTHIAIIDADELLTGNLLPCIRTHIAAMPRHGLLELPQICPRVLIDRMHASGVWAEQHTPVVFADDPALKWENAADGYAHHHRAPSGRKLLPFRPIRRFQGGLLHLQFLDDRRLRAKQCLYKLQDTLRWPARKTPAEINRQYGYAVYGCDVGKVMTPHAVQAQHRFADVPAEWWEPYRALMQYLHPEAEPWQLAECRKLWAEHGAAKFAGLDLFGVVG